jgi:hypothetical protein
LVIQHEKQKHWLLLERKTGFDALHLPNIRSILTMRADNVKEAVV